VIATFIQLLQSLPPEFIWCGMLLCAFATLLLMLRLFGEWGVTVFLCMALVSANIQVLKAVKFGIMDSPVALGTVLFATTYLGTDILSEYYGPKAARRAVMLGFASMILLTMWMLFAIGFAPLDSSWEGSDWEWGRRNHEHLTAVFLPMPAILLAGFAAYFSSQILDIWLYQRIRRWTQNRHRWLRNNASTWVSALIDNIIFSLLAWVILAEDALPMGVVWKTYIFGTYFLRIAVAFVDTPVLYLAKYCVPRSTDSDSLNATAP
jgi:queuosine precursor transporter